MGSDQYTMPQLFPSAEERRMEFERQEKMERQRRKLYLLECLGDGSVHTLWGPFTPHELLAKWQNRGIYQDTNTDSCLVLRHSRNGIEKLDLGQFGLHPVPEWLQISLANELRESNGK